VRTLVAHSPALDPPRLAATALLHLIGAAASAALFASAIVVVAGGRPGLTFARAYGVAAHAALPFARRSPARRRR
jgi:hypothetical protein